MSQSVHTPHHEAHCRDPRAHADPSWWHATHVSVTLKAQHCSWAVPHHVTLSHSQARRALSTSVRGATLFSRGSGLSAQSSRQLARCTSGGQPQTSSGAAAEGAAPEVVWDCDFCQWWKCPVGRVCRQGRGISICRLELRIQLCLLWKSLLYFLTVRAPSGALGVFKWKFTFTVRTEVYAQWAVWWSYQSQQKLKAFPASPTLKYKEHRKRVKWRGTDWAGSESVPIIAGSSNGRLPLKLSVLGQDFAHYRG